MALVSVLSSQSSRFGVSLGCSSYSPRPRRLCVTQHLSVCLLANSCKNYWSDPHENFSTDVSLDEEDTIKFWKSSTSGSQRPENWKTSTLLHCLLFTIALVCGYCGLQQSGTIYSWWHQVQPTINKETIITTVGLGYSRSINFWMDSST